MVAGRWTPGPWQAVKITTDPESGIGFYSIGPNENRYVLVERFLNPANAALIALAPEMAEAILGNHHFKGYPCAFGGCPLCEVADKLRAIGGDDV